MLEENIKKGWVQAAVFVKEEAAVVREVLA